MIKILVFLSIVFSVNLAFGQNYPDIDQTLTYDKTDFSEIDELIAENQRMFCLVIATKTDTIINIKIVKQTFLSKI